MRITSSAFGNALVLLFAFIILSDYLTKPPLTPGLSQEKRLFENTIPSHVPLKVKIKKSKQQSFEDLENEKWVRELELDVTNTGDRPIYFLDMFLRTNVAPGIEVLLEDSVREGRVGLTIQYGRADLGDLVSKPGLDDVPIKPGETFTFTIHSGEVGGWEIARRDGLHPQPTKIQLVFQSLSFGDGTGLFSSGATPYPPPRKRT